MFGFGRAGEDGAAVSQVRHIDLEVVGKVETRPSALVEEYDIDDLVDIGFGGFDYSKHVVRCMAH